MLFFRQRQHALKFRVAPHRSKKGISEHKWIIEKPAFNRFLQYSSATGFVAEQTILAGYLVQNFPSSLNLASLFFLPLPG